MTKPSRIPLFNDQHNILLRYNKKMKTTRFTLWLVLLVMLGSPCLYSQRSWIGPTLECKPFTIDDNGDTTYDWRRDFWIKLYDGEFKMSNNVFNHFDNFYQTGKYEIINDTLILEIDEKFHISDHTSMYFPCGYTLKSGEVEDTTLSEKVRFFIGDFDTKNLHLTTVDKFIHRYRKDKKGVIRKINKLGIDENVEIILTVSPEDYCWPKESFIYRTKREYQKRIARRKSNEKTEDSGNK